MNSTADAIEQNKYGIAFLILLGGAVVFAAVLGVAVMLGYGQSAPDPYDVFEERLHAGAGCAELFKLRNDVDPGAIEREFADGWLRAVGCPSSSSIRQ